MTGRPRQFDELEALDRAVELFWAQGYEATSTRQLADAMGINAQSLYNTYGGKHDLFVRAVQRYLDTVMGPFLAPLQAPDADLDTIRSTFQRAVQRQESEEAPKACLLLNSVMERGCCDMTVGKMAQSFLQRGESVLAAILRRERDAGHFCCERTDEDVARYLVMLMNAVGMMAKAGINGADIERSVDVGLAVLDSPVVA